MRFWDIDMPLNFKKIETFEKNTLRPLGINNKEELENEIQRLTDVIADLEVQVYALTNEENLEESANLIREKLAEERKEGIRKPSTYSQRASEFASVNSDYFGNEYLLRLSQKELIKRVDTITALKETLTYKDLSKEERESFIKKFKEKKAEKSKEREISNKDLLDTRIKALKRLLQFAPKNKSIQMRVKAIERLKAVA